METLKPALTRQDAAQILGVCDRTIDNLIKRGELQSFYVGDRVRIPRESLEAYIIQSKAKSHHRRAEMSELSKRNQQNAKQNIN